VPQEPHGEPDTSGRPEVSADHLLPDQDPAPEEPIMVKRTPRLRSGKHEEPESSD
jgi:hypothetical protein